MNMPTIRARIGFERVVYNGETPKYRVSSFSGSSEFFVILKDYLSGRDGNLNLYLKKVADHKPDKPEVNLQVCRNGMNFSGLFQYFQEGKPSGFACGCFYPEKEYKEKVNPFYEFKHDGLLFKFIADVNNPQNLIPTSFECVVVTGTGINQLRDMYLSVYRIGGFDEALEELPLQSIDTL